MYLHLLFTEDKNSPVCSESGIETWKAGGEGLLFETWKPKRLAFIWPQWLREAVQEQVFHTQLNCSVTSPWLPNSKIFQSPEE